MAITGIGTLRVQPGGPTVARSFTFADSLSWSHGRHIVKLGGELGSVAASIRRHSAALEKTLADRT